MKKYLSILLCLFFLTACNTEKEVLDDITMVRSLGFDKYSQKANISGTILYPIYIDEQTFKMKDLTAAGETAKEVRAELNEMVARPIFVGKLNTVLFSEEIAKEGIMDTLDMIQRDPGVGRAIYLAITKENTKEILTVDNNLSNHDGNFYSSLIKQNEDYSNLPHLNFHNFLYAYFSDCMDPILPFLSRRKDSVKIKGLALFQKDKMVGTIDEEHLLPFKTLYQNLNEGSYQFTSKKYKGNLEILKSKVRYDIRSKPHHHVTLNINVKGRLTEYTKVNAGDPKVIKGIERNIEKKLNRDGQKLIAKFQKLNIDPIGVGEHVRSRTRAFDQKGWKNNYQDLDIKVKYNVTITESGISQ
ncbi:Ger(x)C family spore germination protein [Bacillus sp. NEB1478]|uniref:Ger(x)C family spore germination protein n=1 Tax=Bacillus sp. NEB1478 TaxID=3073816 RepID=UPI0028738FCF|nr:Ger(x)C family spore germination protein [Bacillus sp. NEB1478]WNB92997.1 Ger(x)C family spore germination protein [Bacillus sp. NEB1478]